MSERTIDLCARTCFFFPLLESQRNFAFAVIQQTRLSCTQGKGRRRREPREGLKFSKIFGGGISRVELCSDGRRVREALQEEVALWTVSTVLQIRVAPVRHEAVLALVALAVGKLDAQFRLDKQAVPDLGLPLAVELVRVRVRTVAHLAATFLEVVVHARVRFVQDHARRIPRRQRRDECASGSFRETRIFQQASLDTWRRVASSLIEHARSFEPRRVRE